MVITFDSVELEIGGQRIDKQFGHWMNDGQQLTESNPESVFCYCKCWYALRSGTLFHDGMCWWCKCCCCDTW